MLKSLTSQLRTIWTILQHTFTRAETVQYPEEMPYLAPRYRGRIVLTNDPDGEERCVACNLCAVACPVDCFSRCIMCGMCEEACPTNAIQLTPDFEMCEYDRSNMVYEKEHLQIEGTGKYHDYNFYRVAGLAIDGKGKGEAQHESPPIDVKSLLP